MKLLDDVSHRIIDLMINNPFYGLVSMRLNKKVNNSIKTAQVVFYPKELKFDLEFNEQYYYYPIDNVLSTIKQRQGLILHELGHVIFKHTYNSVLYSNKKLYHNIAIECCVNSLLSDDMLIGDEVTTELINKQYGISMCLNETADYYYNYLNNNLSTEQLDELCDMFEPRLQASYELSDVESLMYDTLLIDIVSESYQRYRGSLSGSVVAYLDAKINKAKPEINWFKELSRFVGSTITTKHRLTKAKPNLLVDEYYGKVLLIKKKILVAIDVSGSVSNDELIVFYNQLRFINNTDNIIEVMQFDSDVKVEPILYTNLNVNKIKIHGRGGTDFQPPIDYFNTNKRKYDMCIVFTDGEASTPTKPHKPILFVISSQGTTNYIKSFKHIQINKNGIKQQTN